MGHWSDRGTVHLHAPQRRSMAGDRTLPHSPLRAGSPEVEWVFTLQEPRVLTLLLTSFTLSMSRLLFPGSILSSRFFFLLEISHSCPFCLSICLSFCLLLCLSSSLCCSRSTLSKLLWPLLWLLKLLIDFLCHLLFFLLPLFFSPCLIFYQQWWGHTLTWASVGLPFLSCSIYLFSALVLFHVSPFFIYIYFFMPWTFWACGISHYFCTFLFIFLPIFFIV